MPAIEGREAVVWIDEYVEGKSGKLGPVAWGLRKLMKKTVAGVTESVNPWKIPTFESNGPMCFSGEKSCNVRVFARNGARGSGGIARGEREKFAACETAVVGGFRETGAREADSAGGEIEQAGTNGRDESEEKLTRQLAVWNKRRGRDRIKLR